MSAEADQDLRKLEAQLALCEARLNAVANAITKMYGHTIFVKSLCSYVFGEASEVTKIATENEKELDDAMDKLSSAFQESKHG